MNKMHIDRQAIRFLALLVCLLVLNSSRVSAAQAHAETDSLAAPLKCTAFSPYINGYDPNFPNDPTKVPPPSVIDKLLDIIVQETDYNCIMTYGASYPLDHIIPAAEARGLKVFEIIWLEPGADNLDRITDGINAARNFSNTIVRVSCGSEVVTKAIDRGLPNPIPTAESTIIECITKVRVAGISQPITSIETWWRWCSANTSCFTSWSNIASKVDWIGVNVYPWWDSKYSDTCFLATEAANYTINRVQQVKALYPTKEVVLTEFGWPAGPDGYRETNIKGQKCDIASEANQDLVVSQTQNVLNNAGIQGIVFEAFREPWKKSYEESVGPFW